MHCFPIVSRHHLDCVPRTAIEKRAVRTFAGALLTSDAQVRIYFDSPKWRMIFIRHPEHTGFDRTVFDTRRGTRAAGAAISRDREYAGPLFPGRLSVAL